MTDIIGKPERATQNRVVKLIENELGFTYLGNWEDRDNNSNIEIEVLTAYLKRAGYKDEQIPRAIYQIQTEANNNNRSLYQNNKEVYSLLRYGASIKTDPGKPAETIKFINWAEPLKNDFAIAEEVTLVGNHERRPDLVLYINGIAIGVIELKNSRVTIGDGIRQCLSNQQPEFNQWFFSTVQFLFAGNDSEGLQYGTIATPEKYFLKWKEDEDDNSTYKLDKYIKKMCNKERLIELIHDFVLFDAGVKKLPRVHQYFGVKAAQEYVKRKESGIIWHTQGSGKSIVMVLLAKWILENNPNARVVVITDRDELDKQIEGVFGSAGEQIQRSNSGRQLMQLLSQAKPRLLCSLIHKFGARNVDNFEQFIQDIKSQPSKVIGEIFVFVDECHRTQSGRLHQAMKAIMPEAVFIGFTGTPLLKKDKATSLQVFGSKQYIHTYLFKEAVEDNVVLDLMYEARDIDQRITSEERVDAWFDRKAAGLNEWKKRELRKHWATMQNVLSSRSRMSKIVADIILDFAVKPRLSSSRGNAILVASSIYEACKYYELFLGTSLRNKCALITSYEPQAGDISREDIGEDTDTGKEYVYRIYTELLENVAQEPNKTKTETYEDQSKKRFVKEPQNMKLLIVVNKLLTGFDAPACTYLYLDKHMEDHGLFQAVCRTNRLDGDDKDFGYIVDYKDLFNKVEGAINVYSSPLDEGPDGKEPQVVLEELLVKAKKKLEEAVEALELLCEPVDQPKTDLEYIHYFCGNTEIETDLAEREPLRATLYQYVANLVRSYATLSDNILAAGFSTEEAEEMKQTVTKYSDLRSIIKNASGESIDLKAYEADMRHLIDTYIEASDSEVISDFDDIPLLELISKLGIVEAMKKKFKGDDTVNHKKRRTVAETIENNIRRKISADRQSDPEFYERMSAALRDVIQQRNLNGDEYEKYLNKLAELVRNLQAGAMDDTPSSLDTPGKKALYNNLEKNEKLALQIHQAVMRVRPDAWRGMVAKENQIKRELATLLIEREEVERIFLIIKAQSEF